MSPGTLLRDARRARGLTQAALAERLGKSQPTIAELERPEANPTIASLDEALNALGFRLELDAVPRRSNVDETLLERNLSLSPRERLKAFEVAHDEVERLRDAMRRAKAR